MTTRRSDSPTIANASPYISWSKLSLDHQRLLIDLCLPTCDGLWVGHLDATARRVADGLLRRELAEWRDAILKITPEGLRVVVHESGLWKREVG